MPKDPHEVGAVWKKRNDRGEYLSLSLDLDALLELNQGTTGRVDIKAYPIDFEKTNPKMPDYRLKFYAREDLGAPAPTPRLRPAPPIDDEPFVTPAGSRAVRPATRRPAPPVPEDDIPFEPRPAAKPAKSGLDDDGLGIPGGATYRRRLAKEKGWDE